MKLNKLKYFILLGIGILLLTGSIIYFRYESYKEDILLKTENTLIESSQNYSLFMKNIIDPLKALVENTGNLVVESHPNSPDKVKLIFKDIINEVPLISSMYFVREEDGKMIESGKGSNSTVDLRQRPWYIDSSLSERTTIIPVYKDLCSEKPVITLSYPVRKDGDLKGVIAADILLEDFYKTFSTITCRENVVHYIVDIKGAIVLHPNKRLLGFSMLNPQKNYVDQISNEEKNRVKDHMKVWNENKENILKFHLDEISYDATRERKVYGYFLKIPETDWTIISGIDYKKVKSHNRIYLIEALGFTGIILMGLLILIYFVFTKIYDIDDLTGIYKKNKLLEVLKKQSKEGKKIILFMDIYNFSAINGNYGSEVGNIIIKELTNILRDHLDEHGLLIHSKADDFIFLFHTEDWQEALKKAEVLNEKLKGLNIEINEINININVFLGLIKLNPLEMKDLDTSILLIEDTLKQLMKTNEKSFWMFPDSHELINMKKDKDKKKEELLKAMEEDRILPFFQPIYNIKENKIEKYEVLMRIKDGDDYLSPFPYIKVAEENNVIEKLDLIVIEKALKYKCKVDSKDKIKLSINVSGRDLNDSNFLPKVVLLADEYEIKYQNLIFEITETQNIKNMDRLVHTIHAFKKLGFKFSIDDFGTGFSSMQYLKRIPADYLKIDGSFIRDLNENEKNLYLVKSIVSMAKAFEMTAIAEFVENEKILKVLKEIGIDYGQGYHIGKPKGFFV
ncbi:MAG: GGDEF domain-containing protein [Anaeromicrobium sp.]|jgi:diguanylate cyclase (GGDEF)-like protein|uniref:GGDEF domain-containing protein n=1 Tax=Anaeromicrobium sp. TaxID=1929132 RepID=UPI0025E1B185|nr:GGDEF domain-containing protein [Anaeromicrobium sp.]MCT4595100.1 GGDEF domain-containing protein [Anaeromicrobium sp.]